MDAQELHARRLNAKEVLTPQRSGDFVFPVAVGTVKIFGWERLLRTSTLTQDPLERGEEQEIFQGNSDEWYTPSHHEDDSIRDDEEAKHDFWTFTGEFNYRHHVVPRELYVPKEATFPIPMWYIDVTRTAYVTGRNVGENIEDYWNVDGERELSDAWTGFTRFILIHETPPDGYPWSGRGDWRENKQPLAQTVYGQKCGRICQMQQRRKQNKDGLSRIQSSTMLDNWEEYSLLSQTMKNSSSQAKPLVESWKFRCQQQCLAKTDKEQWRTPQQYGQTPDTICLHCWCRGKYETKARRSSTQTSPRSYHWKRDEFCDSVQSSAQIHSYASSSENSDAKAAVVIWHGSWRKSETRKRWSMKQGIREEKFISRYWWISVISRNRSWNLSIKSTKAGSCSEVTLQKMILVRTQYSLIKDRQRPKWQPQTSWTFFQTSRMFRSSSRCSIRLCAGQNGRCTNVIENSKVRMPRFLDTSTKAQMANIMVQYGRSSPFLSKGRGAVTLWQDSCENGNVRKFYGNMVGKKFLNGNVNLSTEQKDCSYLYMWTITKWQAEQKIFNRLGNFSWKTLIWKNHNHFLTTYIWDALKESVK